MNHKIALLMTVLAFAQTGCDNLCPTKKLEKPCDSPCEIRIQENCGGHGCYVYKSEVCVCQFDGGAGQVQKCSKF